MDWKNLLFELGLLSLGAGLHVWMKWSNWRASDDGRAAGGSLRSYAKDVRHGITQGVISDTVLFAAILGRETVGMDYDLGWMLLPTGYMIDSGSKNFLPMFQRAVTTKFQQWLDRWVKE